jgi:DNA-directed RNA polymerase specialized sigma subunit
MKCGVMVDHGTIPIPNYWPRPDLVKINNAVWSLEIQSRNILVQWFVLGLGATQLAKEYNVSRGTIYNWRDKAIKLIHKNLTI